MENYSCNATQLFSVATRVAVWRVVRNVVVNLDVKHLFSRALLLRKR